MKFSQYTRSFLSNGIEVRAMPVIDDRQAKCTPDAAIIIRVNHVGSWLDRNVDSSRPLGDEETIMASLNESYIGKSLQFWLEDGLTEAKFLCEKPEPFEWPIPCEVTVGLVVHKVGTPISSVMATMIHEHAAIVWRCYNKLSDADRETVDALLEKHK